MLIKHGSTRTVILIKKWAIKLPSFSSWKLFLFGLQGNIQEREFEKVLFGYVVPIKFYIPGGFCNITYRCDVKSFNDYNRFVYVDYVFSLVEDMKKHKDTKHLSYIIENIVEKKVDSVGMLNGKIYAVDYGN